MRIEKGGLLCILVGLTLLSVARSVPTVRLGFLFPLLVDDAAVPSNLATEWVSAAHVALQVLGEKEAASFTVEPVLQFCDCTQKDAAAKAQVLLDNGVVGVVGPACSEAAIGASSVLAPAGISMVSFAATWDGLVNRQQFPTFFRTVYSDRHQAGAIDALVKRVGFKRAIIIASGESYGSALGGLLYEGLKKQGIPVDIQVVAHPPPADCSFSFHNKSKPTELLTPGDTTAVILAVPPNTALCLWEAAEKLGLVEYPWWFIGADGASSLDFISKGFISAKLVTRLQGQLGIRPWAGNAKSSAFASLNRFWSNQSYEKYPGLLTVPVQPRLKSPRVFVPYLWDAIKAYYVAIKAVVEQGSAPTSKSILQCFRQQHPKPCMQFKGITGQVQFDKVTGDRMEGLAPPTYVVVNLLGADWQYQATWSPASITFPLHSSHLTRPGPLPRYSPLLVSPQEPGDFLEPAPLAQRRAVDLDFSAFGARLVTREPEKAPQGGAPQNDSWNDPWGGRGQVGGQGGESDGSSGGGVNAPPPQQLASTPDASTPLETPGGNSVSATNEQAPGAPSSSTKVKPWVIALVVLIFAALLVLVTVVMYARSKRRSWKQLEKVPDYQEPMPVFVHVL